jgi:hypothetical protein
MQKSLNYIDVDLNCLYGEVLGTLCFQKSIILFFAVRADATSLVAVQSCIGLLKCLDICIFSWFSIDRGVFNLEIIMLRYGGSGMGVHHLKGFILSTKAHMSPAKDGM